MMMQSVWLGGRSSTSVTVAAAAALPLRSLANVTTALLCSAPFCVRVLLFS